MTHVYALGTTARPTRPPRARTHALDTQAINQMAPQALAAYYIQALAGPAPEAAAALKAAAEGGVIQAQLVYGQWLLDGRGVARNPHAAIQWFAHAARSGDPMALNMLGQCHAHGWGVSPNPLMAAYWFRLAAQAGLDWGMYNYATALALGNGVARDRRAALGWFQTAAALGHAKSWNMAGSFYEDGWIVPRNLDTALHHYRQAARGGDFRGQFNAARLLLQRGHVNAARAWLECVPDSATPAFLDKAAGWLQTQPACAGLTACFLARARRLPARDVDHVPGAPC